MQSNMTFDLYPRGCCAFRYFYREARNPVFNVMSDFLNNSHNYQLHIHSPRLQSPSPPQKLQTGLELPSGSRWILQERAFTYNHDGVGDEVAQDLMPRLHCPLSLPFKMHQVTILCPPHNLGTERGHESCVWPPSPRQTEALPALGALATSIWAAPPCSDASSAPFQIQI